MVDPENQSKSGFGMFADELPLSPSPFDYTPDSAIARKRRDGFSCAHDKPDSPPCGRANCSACKKVFRDNVGPQILRHTAHGQWGRIHLVDPTLLLSDADLDAMTVADFDRIRKSMQDKMRKAFTSNGLVPPDVIGEFEFSRETIKENGREVHHMWAPHIHGVIEISQGKERLQAALNSRFWSDRSTPRPALIDLIGNQEKWISYFMKDPRDLHQRIHFRWAERLNRRRDGVLPVPSRPKASAKRRNPEPKKRSMSGQQAEPLMRLLSRIPVQKLVIMLGYQFQGSFMDGRILKIDPKGRSSGSSAPPLGDVDNTHQRGPTDQMDEVDPYAHTSEGFRRFLEFRNLLSRLAKGLSKRRPLPKKK